MDVSSSTQAPTQASIESTKDPIVKDIEVQKQQDQKVQESVNEQTKEVNAQKTGIGSNVNLTA